jgi:SPASM domain peptide maturase of grasp-with-spasm system
MAPDKYILIISHASEKSTDIIDLKEWNRDWLDISKQLEAIKCYHVQIRCYMPVAMERLELIASCFRSGLMQAFEILLPWNNYNPEALTDLAEQNPKLRILQCFNAPEAMEIRQQKNGFGSISTIRENITSAAHCGVIHPSLFSVNTETYTESLAHNSCLNRKISIDTEGNIKNCPSMNESFGNIEDTTLLEAIHNPAFKKYWNITKDEITKCKDCEFRHICTDCRAFVGTPGDRYAAPLKCGYDPYTCVWETWSDHPLKQQAVAHYSNL